MNFGIAVETDLEANKRSALIHEVSDFLGSFLSDKHFGEIENLHIGFICQRLVPGFESFSKQRKPKYVSKQVVSLLDGRSQEVRNAFEYDIKLSPSEYEMFVRGTATEAVTLIVEAIINSLSNFDFLPKKVKNFDVKLFKLVATEQLHEFLKKHS